jgi:predicted amidophosphoribosyltransferase
MKKESGKRTSTVADPRAAEYSRRYRERKARGLPPLEPPICPACGLAHRGARGVLCSRCWERLDPAGRAFKAERVARSRARKKRDDL